MAKKAARSQAAAEEAHPRSNDVIGIALITLGLILLVALALGNGGLLGDGLAQVFRAMFGRGAWAIPALLGVAGAALIAGRTRVEASRVSWGAIIIFVAVTALLAKQMDGDWFDPDAIGQGGGYVGAVTAWGFHTLFGGAGLIGILALMAIGVVMCLRSPVKAVLERLRNRIPEAPKRALRTPEPKPAPTRAAVQLREQESAKPAKSEPKFTEAERLISMSAQQTNDREGYTLPPLDLLREPEPKPKRSAKEMQANIELLEDTLEQFGIEANVVEVATGPVITRYEIQLGPGIRINRIRNLADNIAMNMAAQAVRLEAPIPGKTAIGVEIPAELRAYVCVRELCDNLEFHDESAPLKVALGRDVSGNATYADLTHMPHLLIGGATNSGKSICLSSIITSLLMRNTPKDLKLVMIDPKRVELSLFEGIPHLMCPVVKNPKEAAGVLRAVWREMDRRYDTFSEAGVRNIDGWNSRATYQDRMPYIVVIIDELADLMMTAAAEVETCICRLAQLARATGIHLVIATQRPSVDVITGTIKANVSSRIAFSVTSHIDSRTILDQAGAERLVGKGDMLFMPIDAHKPLRVQGCFVSEEEIEKVSGFWKEQDKPHYTLEPIDAAVADREQQLSEAAEGDDFWEEAVRFVVERKQASTSMLQRRFSIGFQRASRLIDMMEERGVVGARDGPRPRDVLVDAMQAEAVLGNARYESSVPDGEILDD